MGFGTIWARGKRSIADSRDRTARSGRKSDRGVRSARKGSHRRQHTSFASRMVLPWYLIVLGVAVAASTKAAQDRAVALLTDTGGDNTDPLPDVAPDWLKTHRGTRRLWTLVSRVTMRMGRDNLSLVAAGVAFYAMFSIFPALGALVSIYGLFGDTHVVQAQVQQLTFILPNETAKILNDSLNALLSKPNASLNSGLLISLAIAIWAARAGTASLMSGLNVAMERPEQRSFLAQNLVALGLTAGAIVFALVALTVVAVIPLVLKMLWIDPQLQVILAYSRWPVLAVFVLLALDIMYRFGPSLAHPRWHFISVGTVFAATLWIVGSLAFSLYVTRFGSYDTTYGSLGAVIVLLLWFWISALIVLLGATIDSVRADMRNR